MSGHNKWSKIKHKKAVTDAKKSQIFSKYARLIAVESKKTGGDVNAPGLRIAIEQARGVNMPGDNIKRAVEKGVSGTGDNAEQVTYEAYGPGGAALIIEGLTDNKNRTAAEIKHLLSQYSLSLAEPRAASWAFEHTQGEWKAKTTTSLSENDTEKLATVTEALSEHDDIHKVHTNAV
jgi:YebC/PmpR family DNA-binding regulatory protein|tara:strand:- start:10041 stop:10571 length:531 start_codon:yes stop_codon:yes gene_type:complete